MQNLENYFILAGIGIFWLLFFSPFATGGGKKDDKKGGGKK